MDDLDPIERAFAREPELEPSPGFTRHVMREVHRVADEPEPLAFPVAAFAAGISGLVLLCLATLFIVGTAAQSGAELPSVDVQMLDSQLAVGLSLALASVAGSLLLAFRLAHPNRRPGF